MRKPAADKLMQRVGVAVVTGAVLLSQVPAQAIASEAGSSAAPQTASQASAQSEPQQQSDSANPPEPPSGGVATDRGGGNISVDGGTISTEGSGSPIVYSTGDIEVSDVTGTASESQLVGMEGLKTVLIRNSTLSSSQTGKTASDPVADGVIIYQSTSGDAESTTGEAATFQAVDSITIVAGGQTVVQGDSGLTVTVTGSYSTDYDASSDEKDATSQASTASDTDSGSSSDAEKGFFAQVADWLKSLFGM